MDGYTPIHAHVYSGGSGRLGAGIVLTILIITQLLMILTLLIILNY